MAFFGGGLSLRDLLSSGALLLSAQEVMKRGQRDVSSPLRSNERDSPPGFELELAEEA